MNSSSSIPCLVCGSQLQVRLAQGRKSGKTFVMVLCGQDGRHFRGFISDRSYVSQVVEAAALKKDVADPESG